MDDRPTVPAPPPDADAFNAGLLFKWRERYYEISGGELPPVLIPPRERLPIKIVNDADELR